MGSPIEDHLPLSLYSMSAEGELQCSVLIEPCSTLTAADWIVDNQHYRLLADESVELLHKFQVHVVPEHGRS